MKKLFGLLGIILLISVLISGCVKYKKTEQRETKDIVESMYEVTVDSTITSKKYPDAICIVCDTGYFPDYLTGNIVEDQFGNFLAFYGDDVTRENELSKLQEDTKVLFADVIGEENVVINTIVSSTSEAGYEPGSHLSYAHKQFNSDEFLKNCNKNKVTIGVVDTGVDYTHPYIKQYLNIEKSYDFVNGCPDVYDDGSMDSHGTAVTSNIIDILTGGDIDLDFEIINYKGLEFRSGTNYDIANCIRRAVNDGCNIINCSFGGYGEDVLIASAVKYAYDNNVIVVAAAGNEYRNDLCYPAKYPTTISVGSIKEDYSHSEFSNLKADFSAAGENIISAYPGNGYALFSGTSMATPNLVGMCAILYSEGYTDSDSIEAKLTNMSKDLGANGWDEVFGHGIPVYKVDNEEPTIPEPPTEEPTTEMPTPAPTPEPPIEEPTTEPPTSAPIPEPPTEEPITEPPTSAPIPELPTEEPTTEIPTPAPTPEPPTEKPSKEPEKVVLEKITIESFPKTEFYVGDKFDSSNLTLKLHYSDGTTKSGIKTGFMVEAPHMYETGVHAVKVKYEECFTFYNVNVNTPTIQIVGGSVGTDTTTLSVVTQPDIKNVVWNTSDEDIVTVKNGIVKVNQRLGTAVITASVIYNNIEYKATKNITVGYSEWGELSDYRFAKEEISNLKRESVHTLYFWYFFECNNCHYHSSHWNIGCPICGYRIGFESVNEIYAPESYALGGNVIYGKANLNCEVLVKDVTGRFYNAFLSNTPAYIHKSMAVNTAYRYQTRRHILEKIE